MYSEHFGFARPPFRITPDTDLFFAGGRRGEVLDALVYAVSSGQGIVKVVGEVGSGKTMLCRMLEVRLPEQVEICYLANPSLAPGEILHAIALELGIAVEARATRLQVMHELHQRLLERHAAGRRVVVLVEEAQGMPSATLEEIRLLSNLETRHDKLLQIVLFGQPELDEVLARPELRQLRERITHGFRLEPLTRSEVRDYLEYRLRAAGYRGAPLFRAGAAAAIARASQGLTRRVNILADKALLAAFADDVHEVTRRHVRIAVADSEFRRRRRRALRVPEAAMALGLLLLAGIFTLLALDRRPPWPDGDGTVAARGPAAGARAAERGSEGGAVLGPPERVADAAVPAGAARGEPWTVPGAGGGDDPGPADSGAATRPAADGGGQAGADSAPPVRSPVPGDAAPGDAGMIVATEDQRAESVPPPAAPSVAEGASPAAESASPGAEEVTERGTEDTPGPEMIARAAPAASREEATRDEEGGEPAAQPVAATPPPSPPPIRSPAAAGRADALAGAVLRPAAPSPESGLIGERVAATERWLASPDVGTYSIQLLVTDESRRRNLEEFLRARRRDASLEQIYVYRTRRGERGWYGVLYGSFQSFAEARAALAALPDALARYQPFIRNVRDVARGQS